MEKRKDDRDAKKSDDIDYDKREHDQSMQAGELQVGQDGEINKLDRFEPDPQPDPHSENEPSDNVSRRAAFE